MSKLTRKVERQGKRIAAILNAIPADQSQISFNRVIKRAELRLMPPFLKHACVVVALWQTRTPWYLTDDSQQVRRGVKSPALSIAEANARTSSEVAR